MKPLALLPFFLQALAMGFDEFYFHRKRGLPLWEKLGHPLDTVTLLACFAFIIIIPFSQKALGIYIALAFFSCLFVTKDEFIHARICLPPEHWLHSILFILHPLVLISAGFLWPAIHDEPFLLLFFYSLFLIMVLFCLYQIIYWNFLWIQKKQK